LQVSALNKNPKGGDKVCWLFTCKASCLSPHRRKLATMTAALLGSGHGSELMMHLIQMKIWQCKKKNEIKYQNQVINILCGNQVRRELLNNFGDYHRIIGDSHDFFYYLRKNYKN
jgi:hypothetical protein